MSWDFVTLDRLGEISRGKSKHRPRNDPSLFGGKYPFIQTADVKAAGMYLTKYSETYNDRGLAQSKIWPKGTLCITIAANIADTTILGIDACFPDSVMGFIPFKNVANVKFVKYSFDILQRDCKNISQGTAQDNLSWKKLSTIKFPMPSIDIQNKIVDILSAYDDLIENNEKQIQLLEEAAQRLYKEWFIDLRFPGHEDVEIVDGIPEDWKMEPVGSVIKTVPRTLQIKTKDYLPDGTIPIIDQSREFIAGYTNLEDAIVLSETPVIVFGDHTRILKYIQFPFAKGADGTQLIISNTELMPEPLLYLSLLSVDLSNYHYARHFKYLKEEMIIIPSQEIADSFNNIVDPLFKRVQVLRNINRNCEQARDRLLPKLMSGEIEV
ncbi:restriction endonuclease subunit S [Veillonella sp.]|jgi:type I restriction enzyme ecoDI specificity protein|uniref:restriction endonuclease subunit S n=1 Tax=Veillonella sp. TaxID=1926307 RepID=UPI0025D78255|nr:restriction endonuclease subunit S [Veillonella sp.]MBS6675026.1 restriction endonuclease subunit S [Veillonella sp.]